MNISGKLRIWYEKVKRDLPWRNTSDPYKIWISEIILQQTRVNQGVDYYEKFISIFPDVFKLAEARRDSVLKVWQGLGYYSRANNLHETSKYIASVMGGNFPASYKELILLKGIGPYTAAAIASIAFNEPVTAIDGNVKRVLSRLFLISDDLNSKEGKRTINELATSILDRKNPGRHNQAIMELGAMICLPRNPKCVVCPLNTMCLALKEKRVQELPGKYVTKKVKVRYLIYIVALSPDFQTLIHKRKQDDIWKGLYEFPLIEVTEKQEPNQLDELIRKKYKIRSRDVKIKRISSEIIHLLSHQQLKVRFLHVDISDKRIIQLDEGLWISIHDFSQFAVSRLIDRYITRVGF